MDTGETFAVQNISQSINTPTLILQLENTILLGIETNLGGFFFFGGRKIFDDDLMCGGIQFQIKILF